MSILRKRDLKAMDLEWDRVYAGRLAGWRSYHVIVFITSCKSGEGTRRIHVSNCSSISSMLIEIEQYNRWIQEFRGW